MYTPASRGAPQPVGSSQDRLRTSCGSPETPSRRPAREAPPPRLDARSRRPSSAPRHQRRAQFAAAASPQRLSARPRGTGPRRRPASPLAAARAHPRCRRPPSVTHCHGVPSPRGQRFQPAGFAHPTSEGRAPHPGEAKEKRAARLAPRALARPRLTDSSGPRARGPRECPASPAPRARARPAGARPRLSPQPPRPAAPRARRARAPPPLHSARRPQPAARPLAHAPPLTAFAPPHTPSSCPAPRPPPWRMLRPAFGSDPAPLPRPPGGSARPRSCPGR